MWTTRQSGYRKSPGCSTVSPRSVPASAATALGQAGDHGHRHRHHADRVVVEHTHTACAGKGQHARGAGGDARTHLDALTRHLEKHAPWGAQVTVNRAISASRMRSTRPGRSMTRRARPFGRHGVTSRSTWAWAARFRSSPSSPRLSRQRRFWSPAWKTLGHRLTASTRACTWECWNAPPRPRRCCCEPGVRRIVAPQLRHVPLLGGQSRVDFRCRRAARFDGPVDPA